MRIRPTIVLAAAIALALPSINPSPSSAQTSRLAFIDGDGQWQWAELGETGSFGKKGGGISESSAGPFDIVYQDVEESSGVGFDDPEFGESRRATLWAVLDYLGSVLDVPGRADLIVRVSQTDGSGALASAGPFLVPESGFQGGLVFEHLTSGVDPISDSPDGTVSVDFGFQWNSETDAPRPDEHDLFTTLLHEVTHALGLLSVVAPDGRSAVLNTGDRGLFSTFDSLLILESTEMPVFLPGGEINSSAADFAGSDLVFAGERARDALGFYPNVFAPRPFFPGSSIGHWSSFNGSDSLMLPGLSRGTARRQYAAWELQALADLGYDVVACGDGIVAGGEECDDGNLADFDGCTAACVLGDPVLHDAGVVDRSTEPPSEGPRTDAPTSGSASGSGSGCGVHPLGDRNATWLALLLGLALLRRSMHVRRAA